MQFDMNKMIARMVRYMALLGFFLGAAGAASAAPPSVSLNLNALNYVAGNTMNLTVSTIAGTVPTASDVYIALQLPDGTLLYMQANGSFSATLVPFVPNVTVPALTNVPIFGFTFSGLEPSGLYTWFAAVTDPNTLTFQSGLATAQFNLTKPNAVWGQTNWDAAVWQ